MTLSLTVMVWIVPLQNRLSENCKIALLQSYLAPSSDLQSSGSAHVLHSDELGHRPLDLTPVKVGPRVLVLKLHLGEPVCMQVCVKGQAT